MSSPIVVDGLVTLFLLVVRLSWQATIVAALVLGVQWVLGRRLPAVWRHALWAIVLVRLVIPAVPGSAASIFNVLPPWKLTHIAALPNPVRGADTRSQMERGELASIGEETDLPPAMVSPESSTLTTNRATVTAPLTVQTQPSMLLAISIAWLVGVVLLILRTLFTVLRLRRDISRLPRVTDSQVLQLFSVCCRRMRLRRTPELIVGPPGSEVGVTGVWRTSIILPEQVLTHLSTAETEHVLLHELVHVTRGDLIWNWAALGVCHMHWFNPVVWYARYRAKLDAELACDAQVLSLLPASETTSYGMTLLRLLEQASGMSGQPLTVRMIGGKRSLHRRMKMIASYRKTSLLNTALGLAVSLLLCVIGLTGVARSTLATEPPQKPAPEQKLTPKSKVASGDQSAPKSAHVPVPVPVPATLQTVDEATYTEMTLTFNGSPMAEAAAAKDVHFGPHIYISMAQAIRLSRQERPHRGVLINGINLTDFDLEQLRLIPETRDLAIYNTGIEGPGLSQIASLPNLEQLRLFGARCTDAYLAALPQIPKLRSLTIVGGVISPEGLSVLKKFPQLKSLKLAFVPVDDGLQ